MLSDLRFSFETECNDSCGQFALVIVFNLEFCPFGQFGETCIFMLDSFVKVIIIFVNLMKFWYNAFQVVL